MCRYARSASRTLPFMVSVMIFSLRMRRREYAAAVSSKSAPPSPSPPTAFDVRSATSATDMAPMLAAWRARSCSSSQMSRKNWGCVSTCRECFGVPASRDLPHRRSNLALPVRDSLHYRTFCIVAQVLPRPAACLALLWKRHPLHVLATWSG